MLYDDSVLLDCAQLRRYTRVKLKIEASIRIVNVFFIVLFSLNIINPLYESMIINIRQNQNLNQIRDWLLPMLMNGQVTVKP